MLKIVPLEGGESKSKKILGGGISLPTLQACPRMSTIQKTISWKALTFFLIDLAPTLEKSKEVIEILVQELELWVSKVEIVSNQTLEAPNAYEPDAINVDNLEKSDSEEENIVSESVSTLDHEVNDFPSENKLSKLEEFKKDSSDTVNDSAIVSAIDEEFSEENSSPKGFQEMSHMAEKKLDILASRLYEFIGDPDDVGNKDTSEVLTLKKRQMIQ